jgi:hypothetical protein
MQENPGGVNCSHEFGTAEDWVLERSQPKEGSSVWLKLNNHTSRTLKKVFDKYTPGDDVTFSKTIAPVKLAQYGNDRLISRSQAKRVLARVELFRTVLFDFRDVPTIGKHLLMRFSEFLRSSIQRWGFTLLTQTQK